MRSAQRPSILSLWDLAAAAGYLALALFYRRVVPLLPDPVPTHFDALGNANGWTPKGDLALVIFGLTLVPWLALLVVGAAASLVPPRAEGSPAVSIQPLRGLMGLGMAVLMGGCLVIPLWGMKGLVIGLTVFFLCMAAGIALLARASAHCLAGTPHEGHYRWGLFYYNPQDPRIWVEKRVGVGWTLNFARPAAFWVLVLLLAPVFLAMGAGLLAKR
jgi:uncharacterized membrane protein